ncbi:MAG: hypothetical protein JXA87_07705 [Thermoleophilia bacterium]|nr:hypothetical protein [Thermoleophilia bacterium]
MARHRRLGRIVPAGPATAFLLVLALLAIGGCSGSDRALDETTTSAAPATTTPAAEAAPLTVAAVAPDLAVFGDLAAIEAPPTTARFDSAGGEMALADGAAVIVPAGAFAEDTSLTVTVVGLALEYFDPRVGPARTYVIETDRDVPSLDQPVVLEIPFPSEASGVAMLEDGQWVALPTTSGDTTRVEISHFSSALVTHVPMGIEWMAQWGWVISQKTGQIIPGVTFTAAAQILAQEEAHQQWVMTEADQATRDFYGLDENGQYRAPTHTQEEMCKELQTLLAGYSDFSLPKGFDFSPYRLARHLFDAGDPQPQNDQMRAEAWPEFWDYTSASMDVIDRQVLASPTLLTPAQVLEIAIDANGGNVPAGLLAAHNYLKHLSYFGRFYADPTYREEGQQQPVMPETGASAAKLEPWRQEGPANPAGRLDKMGPLYHIFAGAVAMAWFPNTNPTVESFGNTAIAGEALLRTAAGWLGKDTPDREKGRADECGARLGEAVVALASGEKPPVVAGETPDSVQDADGIQDGRYVGEVYPIQKAGAPAWQILESKVELEINDEGVGASVEYVQRWIARGQAENPTCIATIRMLYVGKGSVTTPLSLILTPVEAEIVSVEGSGCEGLEDSLLASFAKKEPRTLVGTFSGGNFDGNIGSGIRVSAAVPSE